MGRTPTSTLHQALRARRHARVARLADFDALKEQIAYRKLWLGAAVVTFISLLGWLISASSDAPPVTVRLAIIDVVLLGIAIAALHRQVERHIVHMRQP